MTNDESRESWSRAFFRHSGFVIHSSFFIPHCRRRATANQCLEKHRRLDFRGRDVRMANIRSLEIFQIEPKWARSYNSKWLTPLNRDRSEIHGGCQRAEAGAMETKTTSVEITNRGA